MTRARIVLAVGLVVTLGLLFGSGQQAAAAKDETVTLPVQGMI
jgi:hypothetical protein